MFWLRLQRYPSGIFGKFCQISKSLSDYMMYLVLLHPAMLPKGVSEVINKDTYHEAQRFFHKNMKSSGRDAEVRKAFTRGLLGLQTSDLMVLSPLKESNSALRQGAWLANQLQTLVTEEHTRWDHEEKWEVISHMWLRMMTYAASRCSWKEHAQLLRHGGELFTHVALIMAHLGHTT